MRINLFSIQFTLFIQRQQISQGTLQKDSNWSINETQQVASSQ